MKQTIYHFVSLPILLVMAVCLSVGCGPAEQPEPKPTPTPTPTPGGEGTGTPTPTPGDGDGGDGGDKPLDGQPEPTKSPADRISDIQNRGNHERTGGGGGKDTGKNEYNYGDSATW